MSKKAKLYPNLTPTYPCSMYYPTDKAGCYRVSKKEKIIRGLIEGETWLLQDIFAAKDGDLFKVGSYASYDPNRALSYMETIGRLDEWEKAI